ncbi:MAG: hypothetical protein ACM3YF_07425 [Candidatus Zixiibacteriota bacterium]
MKRVLLISFVLALSAGSGFAILSGPIKDFYTPRLGDTTAVVFGTRGLLPAAVKRLERVAHRNADYLKQKDPLRIVQVYADTAFPMALFGRRSLVLIGPTQNNRLIGDWKNYFPFIHRDSRFNISGRKLYLGEGLTLGCIFPNPLNHDRYVVLLVGTEVWGQPAISDWPGDYDYYVAQRHTFLGRHLNRGKFEKTSSAWSENLSEYDRTPGDTVTLVGLVYKHGKIWYPFHWEEDSLWKEPIAERIRLLDAVSSLMGVFEHSLGLKIYGTLEFNLSERYPETWASDPMGRIFIRTRPDWMDSLAFFSWGKAVARTLFPCRDATTDWELFGHRYILAQGFYRHVRRIPYMVHTLGEGRRWAEAVTNGDSTYLQLLTQLVARRQGHKIGEALDSVTEEGKKHSFWMKEFTDVLGRIVRDSLIRQLARMPLRPSPYFSRPAFNLGIENPGEMFLQPEVIAGTPTPGSRTAKAGLVKGDRILSVDGFPTATNRSRAYLAWLGKKKGQTLKLVIDRKGVRRTLVIPVG